MKKIYNVVISLVLVSVCACDTEQPNPSNSQDAGFLDSNDATLLENDNGPDAIDAIIETNDIDQSDLSSYDTTTSNKDQGSFDTIASSDPILPKWSNSGGGSSTDWGTGIATDSNGCTYITGKYDSIAKFGNILVGPSGETIFIGKLSPSGNFVWIKPVPMTMTSAVGSSTDPFGADIAIDRYDNIYVVGAFLGTAVFGSTTLVAPSSGLNMFVTKLSPSGQFVWAVATHGPSGELDWGWSGATSIALDSSSNAYVTGYFFNEALFGSQLLSAHKSTSPMDIFVTKISSTGQFVWTKHSGGNGNECGHGIAVDINSNVYVTGRFEGQAAFENITLTAQQNDIFVSKYSSSGQVLWATYMGGTGHDYGNDIAVDLFGNSYVTGYFDNSAVFGTTTLTTNNPHNTAIFVTQISSNGQPIWAITNQTHIGRGESIALGSDGNIFVSGWMTSSYVTPPSAFVTKLSPSGQILAGATAPSSNYASAQGITVDKNNNAYVVGIFRDNITCGTSTLLGSSQGYEDIFVWKIGDPL